MKKQTGLRVDRLTFERFKELCKEQGFRVGEVVEAFMKEIIEVGDIQKALNVLQTPIEVKSQETKARVLLDQIRQGAWVLPEGDRSLFTELLELLPQIKDTALLQEIETALKSKKFAR